jgi:hypothetical protein
VTRLQKGLLLALLQLAIVLGVAGKYYSDRSRLPRVWVRAMPFDPNLPIRGRYVRLRLTGSVEVTGAVAFFIPEHVPDPSRRPPGEELWVEVSVPAQGPPRPIRLGVKKDGVLTPLDLD